MLMPPDATTINRLVQAALGEDAPWGDLTSQSFLPGAATITARLVAREDGVFCGGEMIRTAMSLTAHALNAAPLDIKLFVADGDTFTRNAELATISGSARAILQAERVALNFTQRLSGIATQTAAYVLETEGTHARITDTRKTTPGLRLLERYAVRCGGGHNHRFSLSDAVMVKDNHLAVLAAQNQNDVAAALIKMRASLPHTTHIEVEVDSLSQIEAVLAPRTANGKRIVDTILLDNFTTADLTAAVKQIAGRALIEASGGIKLARVREVAATGVDIISVGALTHSVRALDLGLDIGLP